MTKRKKSWGLRIALFMPVFMLMMGILSAVFSKQEGWQRYAALIGMGISLSMVAAVIFIIRPWWNDRTVLPKMKKELLPILESLTELAKEDAHASSTRFDGDIGSYSHIHGSGASFSLWISKHRNRCSVSCHAFNEHATLIRHEYPGGISGTVRIEPWLREPVLKLLAIIAEKEAASERRMAEIEAILDRIRPLS